jgi:hypothetical protein
MTISDWLLVFFKKFDDLRYVSNLGLWVLFENHDNDSRRRPDNCLGLFSVAGSKAHLTLGVRADVQPKSSIPIGAKVEISPKGFTVGVKADIENNFSIGLRLIINAEHCPLVLNPRLKKGYQQISEANLQPLGPMFQHFIIPWHQFSSVY